MSGDGIELSIVFVPLSTGGIRHFTHYSLNTTTQHFRSSNRHNPSTGLHPTGLFTMPLTVLSDSDVRNLLHGLTREDVLDLQQSLADGLHYYSTSTESDKNGCGSCYQPLRTSLKRCDGHTTLFMPASSNDGLGVKIVTLAVPDSSSETTLVSPTTETSSNRTSSIDERSISSLSSLQISPQSSHTSGSVAAPPTAPETVSEQSSTTPKGALTLLDASGAARGFLNAEEITAFRTALASTMLFKKRHNVHDLVVFGAGKQAYWHIRLALILRGPEIHHLTIINRTYETALKLLETLFASPASSSDSDSEKPPDPFLHRPKIQIITPSAHEYPRHLKAAIRSSSIIFCTTPSLTPLFPASYLTNPEGRKKGRYVAAVGSYKPHMIEIHPDILRQNVKPNHTHMHFHKHAAEGGAVVVDSVEACLKEAGEVIQAGLRGRELVELGELIMLGREAERRRAEEREREMERRRRSRSRSRSRSGQGEGEGDELDEGGVELAPEGGGGEAKKGKWFKGLRGGKGGHHKDEQEVEEDAVDDVVDKSVGSSLTDWLQKGNVIYKSVGLGLMDVVVGHDLVRLADQKGVGVRIADF